jgi:excinuclease ABC subunit A
MRPRFKEEVLEVQYRGKNVYEVLEMSVDEAIEFFKDEKSICMLSNRLSEVGLGYVKLGQSSDTLSGGEAQRVKLASFLGKGKVPERSFSFLMSPPRAFIFTI